MVSFAGTCAKEKFDLFEYRPKCTITGPVAD